MFLKPFVLNRSAALDSIVVAEIDALTAHYYANHET